MTPLRYFALTLCLLLFPPAAVTAAPAADYWSFWDSSDERRVAVIDHAVWDELLGRYVVTASESGVNRFRYGDVGDADRKALARYIDHLADLDPRAYRKREQQAYWMNLYNALSVRVVLAHYTDGAGAPETSPLAASALSKNRIKVAGKKLSLNDIEHRILRPIWQDHRIHFGLNCATLDCPNMDSRAYTGSTVQKQLKEAGRRFVSDRRGVHYADGQLRVSRLFQDHRGDFADSEKALLRLVAHYADDRKALYLLGYDGRIQYNQDLRLNGP